MSNIIAVDNGGNTTKIKTASTLTSFPSAKGEYRERRLVSKQGEYDFVIEYKGRKFMGGTLAKESTLPLQMHTKSKQNIFYDLSILTAIHQYGYTQNNLITCVPIFMHTPNEKDGIKQRLIGTHTITINDETKTFSIENVIVVPETVIAFWVQRRNGITHYVDLGSRTINYGTVYSDNQEMRFIDSQSGTFEHKGLDVLNDLDDYQSLVDYVAGRLLAKWDENEQVYLIGGGAKNQNIFRMFKEYFPNCAVHKNPQMASVEGMYAFGRYVYDAILH